MEQSIIEALKPRELAEVVAFACKLEALGWWASPLGLVWELERGGLGSYMAATGLRIQRARRQQMRHRGWVS